MERWLVNMRIEFVILLNSVRDTIITHIVILLWPEIVYWIVNNTTKFLAPTIPAISMMQEIRNRGILDYYCYIRILSYSTTGEYSSTDVSKLSIFDAMKRFKDSMR